MCASESISLSIRQSRAPDFISLLPRLANGTRVCERPSSGCHERERKVLTRIDRQTHAVVRKEGGEGPTGMSGWREDGDEADGGDDEDQQE